MAINFIKKEDLSHITRTTRQWETTIDRYEIIPKGVLCIELCNDKLTKIKIGNGHLIYEQLPYVSDVNLSDYYTKEETNNLIKDLKAIKIKGEASSLSDLPLRGNEEGDLWFVSKSDPDEHSRYDEYVWYKNKWESFGSSDIDLSEYAKKSYVDTHIQEVQDEITEIIESGYLHKHSNKDILDQTSAVYNVEKDNKLRDLHNYDDTELREKAHTHLNKNILDQTDAVYDRDKDDKLRDLHNYDDTDVKDRISTLEGVAHSHSNQDVLNRTTAAFTKEQALQLLDCKDFEGTDGVHDGYHGFVPAPTASDAGKVLGANGQWVEGGGTGGDVIAQGGGIEITTDPQTGVKTVSVNAGTGLDIDQQTGELYVTSTGGDTIAEGSGIDITTDSQTGVKIISVKIGNHLSFDQTTGDINVDDIIEYTAGDGIAITLTDDIDVFNNGDGWENLCYSDSTGNSTTGNYQWEIHSPISNSLTIPQGATQIKAAAKDTNDNLIWTSFSWIDSNDYHFASTSPNDGHYDDWFDIPSGSVKVNFGVRWTRLSTSQAISTSDVDSVTVMFDNGDTKRIDVNVGDGLSINASDEVELKKATTSTLGGVIVGDNIDVNNGTISVPKAASNKLGVVKPTDGLSIDSNGVLTVDTGDGLSIDSTTKEVNVNVGRALSINSYTKAVDVDIASDSSYGCVKIGEGIDVDQYGIISVDKMTPFRAGNGLELVDESVRLPSAYARVEYVENTVGGGWALINSLVPRYVGTSSDKSHIIARLSKTAYSSSSTITYAFGRWDNYNTRVKFAFGYHGASLPLTVGYVYGRDASWNNADVNGGRVTNYELNDIIDVDLSAAGLKIDNELIHTVSYEGPGAIELKFGVFRPNTSGTPESGGVADFRGRIYSLKLYDDQVLIFNLVPCVQKSSSIVGFYDSVGDTFYPSVGDNPFETDMSTMDIDVADWVMNVTPATTDNIGGIKVGSGLSATNDGALSVNTGDGLTLNQNNELEVSLGDGLSFDANGAVEVNTSIIPDPYDAGNGIQISQTSHMDEFNVQNQEYFFDTRGVTCQINARVYTTHNDGDLLAAVCVHNNGGNTVPLYVGRTQDVVKITQNYDGNILGPNGSFDYLDKTWYYTADYALGGSYDDALGHLETMPTTYTFGSNPSNFVPAAKDLIDLAVLLPDTLHPTISAKIGAGLQFDANNAIEVNAGDGLFIDSTNNDVNVKIGQALSINNDNEIDVDIATATSLGVVKAGSGLNIDEYGNLSTQAAPFRIGRALSLDDESVRLPSGYAKAKYVANTSNAAVRISFRPSDYPNAKYVSSVSLDSCGSSSSYPTRYLCGASGWAGSLKIPLDGISGGLPIKTFFYIGNGNNPEYTSTAFQFGDRFDIEASVLGGYKINNEVVQASATPPSNFGTYNLAIFGSGASNGPGEPGFIGKMYYFRIYNSDDTLLRNLVPAVRRTDNVVGFYDMVGNQFYPSETSTAFTTDMDDLDVDEPDWVLNANIATSNSLGVVKPSTGLVVNEHGALTLDKASASTIGGVKVGNNLSIDSNGVLSANIINYSSGHAIEIVGDLSIDKFRWEITKNAGDSMVAFRYFEYSDSSHIPFTVSAGTIEWSDGSTVSYPSGYDETFAGMMENRTKCTVTGWTGDKTLIMSFRLAQSIMLSYIAYFRWQTDDYMSGRQPTEFNIYAHDSINDEWILLKEVTDHALVPSSSNTWSTYIDIEPEIEPGAINVKYGNGLTVNQNNELEVVGVGDAFTAGDGIKFTNLSQTNKIKLVISAIRSTSQSGANAPYTQMRYVEFYDENLDPISIASGEAIWSDGTTVVYSEQVYSLSEMLSNTNKMCVCDYKPSLVLTFTLSSAMNAENIKYFRYKTGNDVSERDPVSWKIYVNDVNAQTSWTQISEAVSETITTSRDTWTQYFTCEFTAGGVTSISVLPATSSTLGGVIVGNGLTVTSDGTISTATGKAYIAGEGINMSSSQYEFSAENEQYLFKSQVTCELHGSFNREFQKYTDDTALGMVWNVYDSGTLWSGPLFVGLSADAVKYTTNSTTYSALGTFSYLGKTWYYSDTQMYVSNIDGTDYDGNMVVDTETYASTSDIVQACKSLIDRARVILKVDEISLLPATEDTLGGIKIGEGLSIDENNVVSSTVYEEGQGITFETSGSTDSFDVKNKEYYFTDEARSEITGNFGPRAYWRVYTDDPCLAVIFYRSDNTTAPLYIGLTENSVKMYQSWDGNVLGPDGTFDYKGYSWYYTFNYGLYYSSGVDQLGHLQTISGTSADDLEDVAKHVIDLAELINPGIKTYDVWGDGTGWLNGSYNDSQSDYFWTNWYYTYHSKQDEYLEVPTGAIKMRLIGISNENDSRLQGGGVDCFNSSHHHFATVGCVTDEWADIPDGTVYLQFGVKWNELNNRTISSSDIKSVTLEIKVPKNNAITAKLGDGLTFDENDAITLDESIKLIIHCVGTPLT